MIQALALDIDGVLTTGHVLFDQVGNEWKSLYYRDIDAVFRVSRAGIPVALITAEDSPLVDFIGQRLDVKYLYRGKKDKKEALLEFSRTISVPVENIAYVGDSLRDIPALTIAGMSFCPADGEPETLIASNHVLVSRGGFGAVSEAVRYLETSGWKKN